MEYPYSLNSKTILITGASSGIGRETAVVLDQLGATLILTGRNKESLEETKLSLDATKPHIIAPFDLNSTSDIKAWMKDLTKQYNILIDGVVHSAGLHKTIPLRLGDLAHYDQLMNINLYAGTALLQCMLSKKVGKSGFSFVFMSSIMGAVGQSGISAYSASKGAINAFVRSAALEVADKNARVNSIAPGFVKSEMSENSFSLLTIEQQEKIIEYHPLGIGNPKDIAYGAAFLLSDAAKWITGTVLTIDGGYTCH
ncbi:SDR family oxidoreductase [Paenibacillus sp. HJL G12]|uniref:SDR family oxidoreductase n=1 Tax=Paenibacillus dendrobii TaxID=2691084 RepID=A0A7X3LJU0_9BACL|nr:SDR family oxidoreductase [Paenibacillus dendrobii]MWV46625.1 SDR family oxidoreductase [Paenibacillus dendrobii]